jgi:O-6-methylguanine DNA methyltransferase
MSEAHEHPITSARRLAQRLRQLDAESAPPTLLTGVLAAIGAGDHYAAYESPIGPLFVAYNERGVSLVLRADDSQAFERSFRLRFRRPIRSVAELPDGLIAALEDRLRGDQKTQLRVDLRELTPFERAVLIKAMEIPRGEVRPYAWIAREIGHPAAVRAVGTALGGNPVPLLIPCHRVVRSDGQIGNYIFGSATKRAVLEQEGAAPSVLEQLGRAGVRFLGDPDDGTFCLPTCGGLHRRAERLMQLHSEDEALATGLQPCRSCRPVGASLTH